MVGRLFEPTHGQLLQPSEGLRLEKSPRGIECCLTLTEWPNFHTLQGAWNELEETLALPCLIQRIYQQLQDVRAAYCCSTRRK